MKIPDIETRPLSEIRSYQEGRLIELLEQLKNRSPFYRRLFSDNGVSISGIRRLEDLQNIPPTSKDHLQQHNDEFICVPGTGSLTISPHPEHWAILFCLP